MKKQVKLTESEIKEIINKTVRKTLKEYVNYNEEDSNYCDITAIYHGRIPYNGRDEREIKILLKRNDILPPYIELPDGGFVCKEIINLNDY